MTAFVEERAPARRTRTPTAGGAVVTDQEMVRIDIAEVWRNLC